MSASTAATTTVARPNRDAFNKEIETLKKELAEKFDTFNAAKAVLDAQGTKAKDSEWEALLEELKVANKEKSEALKVVQDKQGEVKTLEQKVKQKLNLIQEMRPKNGAKSERELQERIASLERSVESGSLSPLDERKTIKEITAMKQTRQQFTKIGKLQTEIDAERSVLNAKKKDIDQSALNEIKNRVAEINKKLDARKASNQEQYKKLSAQRQQRNDAQSEIRKLKAKIDTAYQEFNAKQKAYRDQAKELQKQREAEEAAAKASEIKAKKLAAAQDKVDAAKAPAFLVQLRKAETLLNYFDKSYIPETSTTSLSGTSSDGISIKREARKVEAPTDLKTLKKAGPEPTLSRKQLKFKAAKSSAAAPKESALQLDFDIIEDLSELKIALPTSNSEVEKTTAALREKIEYYNANNERVTKERVERAEAELKKIQSELETAETAETAETVSA